MTTALTPSPSAAPAATVTETTVSEMRTTLMDEIDYYFRKKIFEPRSIPWCLLSILSTVVKVYGDTKVKLDYFNTILEMIDKDNIESWSQFAGLMKACPEPLPVSDDLIAEAGTDETARIIEIKVANALIGQATPDQVKMIAKVYACSKRMDENRINRNYTENMIARIKSGEFKSYEHFAAKGLLKSLHDDEDDRAAKRYKRDHQPDDVSLWHSSVPAPTPRKRSSLEEALAVDSGSNGDSDPGRRARV